MLGEHTDYGLRRVWTNPDVLAGKSARTGLTPINDLALKFERSRHVRLFADIIELCEPFLRAFYHLPAQAFAVCLRSRN